MNRSVPVRVLGFVAVLTACSAPPPAPPVTPVAINNFTFSPSDVTIKTGATVTWTNDDAATHTVTSDTAQGQDAFDSGALVKGASYSRTFARAGDFPYHCNIHPQMTATVHVRSP